MAKRYGNIVGWGMQVPERVITNQDLEKLVDTDDEWIVSRTGIRERHIVSPGETASEMAIGAAKHALAEAGVKPSDLGLIIVATSSPDYLTPPISSQVQHGLGAKEVGPSHWSPGVRDSCTGYPPPSNLSDPVLATTC